MTDFETHPVGTADLLKRLRSNTPNMAVGHAAMRHAADRIEQLEAALTRANAATAAAYEVAARMIDSVEGAPELADTMLVAVWDVQRNIRAIATPDQTAALDKLIAEAEARGMKRAAEIANKLLVRAKFGGDTRTEVAYSDFVGAAILAASKKGGV